MVTDPDAAPTALGVKVTLTVQKAPAAKLEPQSLVCPKSPVAATPVMPIETPVGLVSFVVFAAVVVPTA
jgi:hypothetical protein